MNPKPDLDFEIYAESLKRCIENYRAIIMKHEYENTLLDKLCGGSGNTYYYLLNYLVQQQMCNDIYGLMKEMQKYSEPIPEINFKKSDDYVPDEKDLKKRIKHAKTPMEKKMYEKQLNEFYKKKKNKIVSSKG